MALEQKTKTGIIILFLVILTFLVIHYKEKSMFVEIIYFKRPGCRIVDITDLAMEEIEKDIGEKVNIRVIDLNKELTEQEKMLVKKYEVIGTPEIIINGKKYTDEFTKNKIKEKICGAFLIRHEGCK
jgi:glutaredoxin